MAITINGDGTLTGVSVGGLPDGIVDTDMLATNAVSAAKLQSTAIASGDLPSGSILQVVQATLDDTQDSFTSSTFADTSLSATITPSSTSSKILIITNNYIMNSSADVNGKLGLKRGSTILNSSRALAVYYFQAGGNEDPWNTSSMMFLDSPSATTATTYKVVAKCSGGTFYVGHGSGTGGSTETMTLMEVAG